MHVSGEQIGAIGRGVLLLTGFSSSDTASEVQAAVEKVVHLRIFEDSERPFHLSLCDVGAEVLVVSQFTLYGDCRKGRRPDFVRAMKGPEAEKLYHTFIDALSAAGISRVEQGRFGADMQVSLVNDGPVTLLLEFGETGGAA